ncbi:putative membrane protein, partial [Vibrio harveyi]
MFSYYIFAKSVGVNKNGEH